MEFHPIFPTIIGCAEIPEHELIRKKYAPRIIDQFKTCPNEQAPWANQCNTWQVKADDQVNELFTKYFEKHIHEWFEEFRFPRVKYSVFMWVNVHTWYMYQDTHCHQGDHSILCGNYNLQLNPGDRPLQFTRTPEYRNLLDQETIEAHHLSLSNKSSEFINIKEGDLILFSPTQKHFVPCATEKHDGYRITLSFNVEHTSVHPSGDA